MQWWHGLDDTMQKELSAIKVLSLDVDGVLTDGSIYCNELGEVMKRFHVLDGAGIKSAQNSGVHIIIISGRSFSGVNTRAHELGIKEVYQGIADKQELMANLLRGWKLNWSQVAHMGDDEPDVELMKSCGFSFTPFDAHDSALQAAKIRTQRKGGNGAVREAIDGLLFWRN